MDKLEKLCRERQRRVKTLERDLQSLYQVMLRSFPELTIVPDQRCGGYVAMHGDERKIELHWRGNALVVRSYGTRSRDKIIINALEKITGIVVQKYQEYIPYQRGVEIASDFRISY